MNNQSVDVDLITRFDNEAKLHALNSVYAIAEFDLAGKLIEANPLFCKMLGYKKEDIIQKNHTLFMPEALRQKHDHFWHDVIKGNINAGEFQRKTQKGDIIWLHAAYTPIIDHSGRRIGVIKLALDITQEKRLMSEHRAQLDAIENSQGVIEFDKDGYITHVNKHYLMLTGYEEKEILGLHHKSLCDPLYTEQADYQTFWETLHRGHPISGRFHRLGKGRHSFWIQATYSPVMDSDGNVRKIIKYAHNITQNVETEKKAHQQGIILDILLSVHDSFLLDHNLPSACDKVFERLLSVTNSTFGFIATLQEDEDGQSLYLPAISNLAWDDETLNWYRHQRRTHGGLRLRKLDNLFGHVVTHNTVVCTNNLLRQKAGRDLPPIHPALYSLLGIPITHNGKAIGMIALANRREGYDQTMIELLAPLVKTLGIIIHARSLEDERTQIEASLRFNAGHDFLTGLPNRSSFFEQANAFFQNKKQSHQTDKSCLAIIDIDLFKNINDQYGHLAGDAVLRELAMLMRMSLRQEDLVARLGGEEFIILLKDVSYQTAVVTIERIRQAIEQHTLEYDRQNLRFTISAGIAAYCSDLASVEDWIQLADENLYAAKRQGRNCVK
ncbi:sensor domain-containing diguanylate cyclase [Pectobacterium brasiliense]|uniref:sensor domain-containing diguanylate cyclase n=1 Tax=Pectobacterium brasiliense TaxID=180957 RepID=UPI0005827C8D|nr:diguanylate cyclase [Pectobacterium brasiliense]KHT04559.1 diguanylate cyclase [Pectobacterium brasiliense]